MRMHIPWVKQVDLSLALTLTRTRTRTVTLTLTLTLTLTPTLTLTLTLTLPLTLRPAMTLHGTDHRNPKAEMAARSLSLPRRAARPARG